MKSYESVLRRVFTTVVPGHRIAVHRSPQPATGLADDGFHVSFPITDSLAEAMFGDLWRELDGPLRFQLIAYLAGHESMHGWEMSQGYPVTPTNTFGGMLSNILADIRGDFLPVLDRLTNWATNREIAYRLLCAPTGTPADAEAAEDPHHNALRVVEWGLQLMRCGRLYLSDTTTVDAPTDPHYADVWPSARSIMIQARDCDWRDEPPLVDELIELLWSWTAKDTPITERTARPDFEERLRKGLADGRTEHGCHLHDTQLRPRCIDHTTSLHIQDITASELNELAEEQYIDAARHAHLDQLNQALQPTAVLGTDPLAAAEQPPTRWVSDTEPAHEDKIRKLAHLVPVLSARLARVLLPLLEGTVHRRKPASHGNRLDLNRQAERIYIQARHTTEATPPIWLHHSHHHGQRQLHAAIVVDCSESMIHYDSAAACFAATAAIIRAADQLGDHMEVALAGFTKSVLTIKGFADHLTADDTVDLLALAQSVTGGTDLTPAIAWGLVQLDTAPPHRSRRLLVILTDAELEPDDATTAAARTAAADEDITILVIGLDGSNEHILRPISTNTVVLPPEHTETLPLLLQRKIEQIVEHPRT